MIGMDQFVKSMYTLFMSSNTFEKGAALAYYSVFSILPMLILVIAVFGFFFGDKAVSGEIFGQLKNVLGVKGANQIQDLIQNQHTNHNNLIASLVGFVTLVLSASGMFNQMQSAFNDIWQVPLAESSGILTNVIRHFTSFCVLLSLFFIMIASTGIHSFIAHHSSSIPSDYSFIYWLEHLLSYVLTASCFMLMFRFLGDADFSWKICAAGGLFTAVLFLVGKVGIGYYLSSSTTVSVFGSASILALIMVWVYYISQVIFLGAVFVKVLNAS